MSAALVASTVRGATGPNTGTTSSAINGSSGNFSTILSSIFGNGARSGADSEGNTYLLAVESEANLQNGVDIFYCANAAVSAAMTASMNCPGGANFGYPTYAFAVWSGIETSSPLDGTNSGRSTASSQSTGSVTPSVECLVVAVDCWGSAGDDAPSALTTLQIASWVSGQHNGHASSYDLSRTTSTSETFSGSGSEQRAAAIAAFKVAASAGPTFLDRRFPRGILRGAA